MMSCSASVSLSIAKMPPFPLKGNGKLKKKWKHTCMEKTQEVLRGGMQKISETTSSTTF